MLFFQASMSDITTNTQVCAKCVGCVVLLLFHCNLLACLQCLVHQATGGQSLFIFVNISRVVATRQSLVACL